MYYQLNNFILIIVVKCEKMIANLSGDIPIDCSICMSRRNGASRIQFSGRERKRGRERERKREFVTS